MSERKALVEQATAKLAAFNRTNADRIRQLQNSGGSSLDPAGFNPDQESVGKMLREFYQGYSDIFGLLEQVYALDPEPDNKMAGSAWPSEDQWGL
jgi:hypothetical protein